MRRISSGRSIFLLALALVGLASAVSATSPAVARPFSPCDGALVANAGEPPGAPLELYEWRVRARGVGCDRAVRIARRYLKHHAQGSWVCGSTHFEAGCSRGAASISLRAVHPLGRPCGEIGFEPNSDNGASEIWAQNVGCGTARSLVRAVYEETDRLGFDCRGREYAPIGLPYTHWVCHRQDQRVRWLKY